MTYMYIRRWSHGTVDTVTVRGDTYPCGRILHVRTDIGNVVVGRGETDTLALCVETAACYGHVVTPEIFERTRNLYFETSDNLHTPIFAVTKILN